MKERDTIYARGCEWYGKMRLNRQPQSARERETRKKDIIDINDGRWAKNISRMCVSVHLYDVHIILSPWMEGRPTLKSDRYMRGMDDPTRKGIEIYVRIRQGIRRYIRILHAVYVYYCSFKLDIRS